MTPQKILLVEDEQAIADAVVFALQSEGLAVKHCLYAQSALESLRQEAFHLAVLDVGLPDMSGFDLLRQLRAASTIPAIMLTARNDEIDRVLGLELGADDYVTKPFSSRELVARVRAHLRRAAIQAQAVSGEMPIRDGVFELDSASASIHFCAQKLNLTKAEYGILCKLLTNARRVLSRAQLQDNPCNNDSDALERTVDAHIKALRAKLRQVDNTRDPIQTHRGFGYCLDPA